MKRYYSLDTIKFLAVISVVIIHVTAVMLRKDLNTFWNYDIYRPILNFAVPFFFTASGFLLYFKKDNEGYLWGYLVKSIKIYLYATLFYILFNLVLVTTDRVF
ncbi:acyltransferase family protein [Paenibacillus sp. 1001270B_150601_E10]|uniref:acyltransferase family protein n=1 Tax=Paenibacillus sp. 1001270B_150601_E10 TaxID=2787079 RepID=UPI00189E3CDE